MSSIQEYKTEMNDNDKQDWNPRTESVRISPNWSGALAGALAKAQGAMPPAFKTSDNPYYKSKYSDLASVWDACRAPLAANAIAVVQAPLESSDGRVRIETILIHSSGEWISGRISIKPVKDDPQAFGSATTYARRYSLQAMVGIASEDDDGNAASGKDVRKGPVAEPVVLTRPKMDPPPPPILTSTQLEKTRVPPKEELKKNEELQEDEKEVIIDEPEYISIKQKQYLSRRFRESLRPELEARADELRHQCLFAMSESHLFKSRFIDDYGNPTQDLILQSEYEQIGKSMVKAAKSL
jgi:ERF superfamily